VAQRNLVVIVADTLRDPKPLERDGIRLMPFIEEFARKGVVLDRLFASSSWTAPSHVSLLTGADPWSTHFHLRGAGRRSAEAENIANRWTKAGGEAVGFSANLIVAPQLGTAPGYTSFNPGFPARLPGFVQIGTTLFGYERALYRSLGGDTGIPRGPVGRIGHTVVGAAGSGLYRTVNSLRASETLARSVARYIHQRPTNGAPPLHLFLNIVEAHEPYLVGLNGGPPGTTRSAGHLPSFNLARLSEPLKHRSESESFLDAYRHALTATDDGLRTLIEVLRRTAVLDNAVLVVLSDHGQSLGEHGFFGHAYCLYDELVKVPGYVWEFRNGRPIPLEAPEPEWYDHRHLYDVLASSTADGAPIAVRDSIAQSLMRRGPATSYFEGPGLRAPDGFTYKVPRPPTFRILRVQRGRESSVLRSDAEGGDVRPDTTTTTDPVSAELEEIARHILTREIVTTPSADAASAKMDDAVDSRLKSWGYD
jgi:Sulfatase